MNLTEQIYVSRLTSNNANAVHIFLYILLDLVRKIFIGLIIYEMTFRDHKSEDIEKLFARHE